MEKDSKYMGSANTARVLPIFAGGIYREMSDPGDWMNAFQGHTKRTQTAILMRAWVGDCD
jgi:hypothetical protein